MTKHRSIAIDGPSGAGKSTLARALAKALGYLYVDTGAIYRTVGLQAFRTGADPEDRAAVIALLPGLDIGLGYGEDGEQRMYLNGEDVSQAIRQHEISWYASCVSAIPEVRAFLLDRQRKLRSVSHRGAQAVVSPLRTTVATSVSRSGTRRSSSVFVELFAAASSRRRRMPSVRIRSASAARSVSNSAQRSRRAWTEAASSPSRVR